MSSDIRMSAVSKAQNMGFDSKEPEQSKGLQGVLTAAGISTETLWLHYVSLSGSLGELEVDAYLEGALSIPSLQRDILALAANELSEGTASPHAPYAEELLGSATPENPVSP
ncbi:hypothetical protein ACIPY2_17045 [Paenarthrobacter sp. NPDC089675]|uniref:hypothetical protein n=1 Tax=Paenarthrobacter sp. NPDC089675 TaxID=3364376 RepID=UPI00382DAAC9